MKLSILPNASSHPGGENLRSPMGLETILNVVSSESNFSEGDMHGLTQEGTTASWMRVNSLLLSKKGRDLRWPVSRKLPTNSAISIKTRLNNWLTNLKITDTDHIY